mmetsp:Transcript_54161/g.156463  ORF Transcript_54161/g.156463 Transcript_54161/m.156463 type:complete len:273 (+) Transcript_54161:511-1329(+)
MSAKADGLSSNAPQMSEAAEPMEDDASEPLETVEPMAPEALRCKASPRRKDVVEELWRGGGPALDNLGEPTGATPCEVATPRAGDGCGSGGPKRGEPRAVRLGLLKLLRDTFRPKRDGGRGVQHALPVCDAAEFLGEPPLAPRALERAESGMPMPKEASESPTPETGDCTEWRRCRMGLAAAKAMWLGDLGIGPATGFDAICTLGIFARQSATMASLTALRAFWKQCRASSTACGDSKEKERSTEALRRTSFQSCSVQDGTSTLVRTKTALM